MLDNILLFLQGRKKRFIVKFDVINLCHVMWFCLWIKLGIIYTTIYISKHKIICSFLNLRLKQTAIINSHSLWTLLRMWDLIWGIFKHFIFYSLKAFMICVNDFRELQFLTVHEYRARRKKCCFSCKRTLF